MLLPLKAVQQLSMVEGQSMRHGAVSRHPESGHGKQWCETRAKLTLPVILFRHRACGCITCTSITSLDDNDPRMSPPSALMRIHSD